MTPMDMVAEFARKTGQPEGSWKLYEKLIMEEYKEWTQDVLDHEHDLKELCDLVYVIYGYCYHRGWDLDEAIRRVHANNLGRCIRADGTIERNKDGKIIKNKNYPHVDLRDLVNMSYWLADKDG